MKEFPIPAEFAPTGAGLVGPFKVLLARLVAGIRFMESGQPLDGAAAITPSFEDGLKVQKVLDGVRASSEGAGWVKVDFP